MTRQADEKETGPCGHHFGVDSCERLLLFTEECSEGRAAAFLGTEIGQTEGHLGSPVAVFFFPCTLPPKPATVTEQSSNLAI